MEALVATTAAAVPALTGLDGGGLTTSVVSGIALSHALQPYMALVPAGLKPVVAILTAVGGSVVTCMSQGMGFKEALHYGLVTAVSSLVNHRLAFAKK